MKISAVLNHGKPRFKVNVQKGAFRRRMFFETAKEALDFCEATGGPINTTPTPRQAPPPPPPPAKRAAPQAVRQPAKARQPRKSALEAWMTGEGWEE